MMGASRSRTGLQARAVFWGCIALAALAPLSASAGAAPDAPRGPEEEASGTRALPMPGVRPTTRPRALLPGPQVDSFQPSREMIAGGTIVLRGSDLRPSEILVRLGTLRPVTLTVLRSTSTQVHVRVPESAITSGSPLTVQYPGSRVATLAPAFTVHPRPKFSNLTFRSGPRIGSKTEMEATVTNFAGLENEELSWWSDCWPHGRGSGTLPATGSTGRIRFDMVFRMSDPALGPTEQLMALSGRRCSLTVSIGRIEPRIATGLSVQLPSIARYVVENTWDLRGYSTPSGRTFGATASGLPGVCGPLSVGTAGSFPIGVVPYENDISFQLRNGLINLSCEFTTSPRLQVKDGWQITEVDWNRWNTPGGHCRAGTEHVEWAPGHWGYQPPLNPEYLDRVKMVVGCVVDSSDRARNSHLFRAVLRRIVLVGPPRQSWRSAFR